MLERTNPSIELSSTSDPLRPSEDAGQRAVAADGGHLHPLLPLLRHENPRGMRARRLLPCRLCWMRKTQLTNKESCGNWKNRKVKQKSVDGRRWMISNRKSFRWVPRSSILTTATQLCHWRNPKNAQGPWSSSRKASLVKWCKRGWLQGLWFLGRHQRMSQAGRTPNSMASWAERASNISPHPNRPCSWKSCCSWNLTLLQRSELPMKLAAGGASGWAFFMLLHGTKKAGTSSVFIPYESRPRPWLPSWLSAAGATRTQSAFEQAENIAAGPWLCSLRSSQRAWLLFAQAKQHALTASFGQARWGATFCRFSFSNFYASTWPALLKLFSWWFCAILELNLLAWCCCFMVPYLTCFRYFDASPWLVSLSFCDLHHTEADLTANYIAVSLANSIHCSIPIAQAVVPTWSRRPSSMLVFLENSSFLYFSEPQA